MFSEARRQPRPRYLFASPSRSSKASAVPVDAPEGTDAEALTPSSRTQVARTVGLPRLSRISRPESCLIVGIGFDLVDKHLDQIWNLGCRLLNQSEDCLSLSHHLRRCQILQWRFSGYPRKQASERVSHDPRLQLPGPAQLMNSFPINLPEQLSGTRQTVALSREVMRLAEKVRQGKADIKSGITEVNHFIVEQN